MPILVRLIRRALIKHQFFGKSKQNGPNRSVLSTYYISSWKFFAHWGEGRRVEEKKGGLL